MIGYSIFTWEDGLGVGDSSCVKIESTVANDARYMQAVSGLLIGETYHVSAMIKVESIDMLGSPIGATVSLIAYSGWATFCVSSPA